MSETHTQCPHCGFVYTVTPEQSAQMAGQSFACTQCGRPFTLSPSGGAFAQPPQQVTYASGTHVKSNPLAIASLICGCILCVPFLPGIAAIVTGAIGMRKARDPAVTGKGMAIAGLTLGVLNILGWGAYVGLIAAIMVPSMGMARQTANQVQCASNLKQIGLAIQLYADANNGAYPDTIEELAATHSLTGAVYDCPSTSAAPPTTSSPQALAGKIEYIYVGKGMSGHIEPKTVIAYEPTSNHGSGSNMLFADGAVDFITGARATQMIQQIKAGQNPPAAVSKARRRSTSQPAVEVEQ